jgi:uncharacterized phage-associated protein
MHSSLAVANKLLKLAEEANDTVTPMELIKLVYLCHGWMLGLYGRALVREPAEAWAYGPVYGDLYQKLKKYGGAPVLAPIKGAPAEDFDYLENDVVEQVYKIYGNQGAIPLSKLTHKAGSPWAITWEQDGKNGVIPDDLIEYHYQTLYKRLQSNSEEETGSERHGASSTDDDAGRTAQV